jgi:hypothetical protein
MKLQNIIRFTAGLLFLGFQILPAFAQAQKEDQEAPLGLTWGISASQVRALGADLKDGPRSDFGVAMLPPTYPVR